MGMCIRTGDRRCVIEEPAEIVGGLKNGSGGAICVASCADLKPYGLDGG
jgi:hypothetical protein